MKKIFIAVVALCSFNAISAKAAQADMDFYAKASVSFELESEGTEDYTAVIAKLKQTLNLRHPE